MINVKRLGSILIIESLKINLKNLKNIVIVQLKVLEIQHPINILNFI